jgi:hypothetical protein
MHPYWRSFGEVEFIQNKLTSLSDESDGFFYQPEINAFTASFQQNGGWWKTVEAVSAPDGSDALNGNLDIGEAQFQGEGEFFLVPFMSPTLGDAGANKPWLQELPDPTTTVMWNTWVELNPKTAEELHDNDDVVLITSAAEPSKHRCISTPPSPETVGILFGGHTAYGRLLLVPPTHLFGAQLNEAGDWLCRTRSTKDSKQYLSGWKARSVFITEGLKN